MERGDRPLTAGEEAERMREGRGGEAWEAEAGKVAEAPAASTEALGEDAPDEIGGCGSCWSLLGGSLNKVYRS